MLPGQSTVIVNDGQESEDRKILTDEMAETILSNYPSYSELIGINPQWVDPNDSGLDEIGDGSDEPAPDAVELLNVKTELADLQEKYDALVKEHEQLKADHSVTKGLLTKANNKLARQAEPTPTTTVTPVTPVASPVTTPDPAITPSDATPTDVAHTDALEGLPSTAPASTESKGNGASNATQEAITGAQQA